MSKPMTRTGDYPLKTRWKFFVHDFLWPIIADGKIDSEEETPLMDSFIAYRIDEIIEKYGREILYDQLLPAAIEVGLKNPQPVNPKVAWYRINPYLATLETTKYQNVKGWLSNFDSSDTDEEFEDILRPQESSKSRNVSMLYTQFIINVNRILKAKRGDDQESSAKELHQDAPQETTKVADAPLPELPHPEQYVVEVTNIAQTPSPKTIETQYDQLVADKEEIISKAADQFKKEGLNVAFCGPITSTNSKSRLVVIPEEDIQDTWFIGDLHGDILALETSLTYIAEKSPEARIVFLGDIFDGERYNCAIMLRIFHLLLEDSRKYCLITGNHDCGLSYSAPNFLSSVSPCDYADELNTHIEGDEEESEVYLQLGLLTVDLFANAPRALFFPDGLLVAHGGFPLDDLWDNLDTAEDLYSDLSLQDFIWTRASKGRHKRPNRAAKGCQFGYHDFEQFCAKASGILDQPVTRMIRGHDHVEDRFTLHERYKKNPILTINTISHRLDRENFGPDVRVPCIARYRAGDIPEVHRLHIPEDIVQAVHPRIENEPDEDDI